jgi:tetratricopeptide (TPR) repeat protein
MNKVSWIILKSILLIGIGLFTYWPIFSATWVWDDTIEILTNSEIHKSFESLVSIWINPQGLDYFPLKTTLQWFEWHIWGANPLGYHLMSLGLHLFSSFIIWRIFKKLGFSLSWLGAILFLVHPLAVQSVAWVSELKNTLSLPFLLLSFDTFIDYENFCFSNKINSKRLFLLSLGYFILAMLAKSSVVMLPLILLLYIWCKRNSISKKDFISLSPFFLVSLILGIVTIFFQHTRAIAGESFEIGSFFERCYSSILIIGFYLKLFFFPLYLTPIYPRWSVDNLQVAIVLGWLSLLTLLIYLFRNNSVTSNKLLLGLGWFIINLIPVLGIIPMSFLKYAQVSDHFTYISIIGSIALITLFFSTLHDWVKNKKRYLSYAIILAKISMLIFLAYVSNSHAKDFQDDLSFYTKIITDNPSCWMAHDNLGNIYNDNKLYPEAIAEYNEVLKLNPHYAKAHFNLGLALVDFGNIPEGISHYKEAITLHPEVAEFHNNLGIALSLLGKSEEAILEFKNTLKLNSKYSDAELNWGLVLARDKRIPEAIEHLKESIKLNPKSDHAHLLLGYAYQALERQNEADQEFSIAKNLKSNITIKN